MNIKVTCLGVGNGTSYILRGNPSSSFVISVDDEPLILIDCGLGVGLQYQKHFGHKVPQFVYISHNHLDHTGELPILLLDFYKKSGKKVNVLGNSKVLEIVKKYRMHEFYSTGIDLDEIANWIFSNEKGELSLFKNISLKLIKSKHSYICYGFVMKVNNNTMLGYTGDSGFSKEIYDFVSEANKVILDGRKNGSNEHASFSEIEYYASSHREKNFFITHHEFENSKINSENVEFLKIGKEIRLCGIE